MVFTPRYAAAAAVVVAATLAVPAPAGAMTCYYPILSTGVAGAGPPYGWVSERLPAGSPDPDWLVTAAPLLGSPAASVVTDPFPGWTASPYVGWITVPGAGGAGPYPDLSATWPPGVYTYEYRFAVPPGAYVPHLSLSYLADNGVQFTLNGTPIGGYVGTGPHDVTPFQVERGMALTPPPVIAGVNVLQARVTNFGGPTGLLVNGYVTVCV